MQEAMAGGLLFSRDDLPLTNVLGSGSGLPRAVSLQKRHPFIRVAAPGPGKAQENQLR